MTQQAGDTAERDVVLIGAGGHAHVVADMLAALGRPVRGFIAPTGSTVIEGIDWLGTDDVLAEILPGTADLAMGVGSAGDVSLRRRMFDIVGYGRETQAAICLLELRLRNRLTTVCVFLESQFK